MEGERRLEMIGRTNRRNYTVRKVQGRVGRHKEELEGTRKSWKAGREGVCDKKINMGCLFPVLQITSQMYISLKKRKHFTDV